MNLASISLFSHAAAARANSYGAICPPRDLDDERDEAIFEQEAAIWENASDLEDAIAYDRAELNAYACAALVAARPGVMAKAMADMTPAERALAAIIWCIDKEVHKAAVREIDGRSDV